MHLKRIGALSSGLILLALVVGGPLWLERHHATADLLGDASCDGTVNAVDAALILQHVAGFAISFHCPAKVDVNGDGGIGPVDAALVLQFSAGLIDSLGHAATPTPTRTPAATRTATSIPSTPSGSLSIRHTTWYVDSSGGLWVVGEVYNGLDDEAEVIGITANLYSASNTLLDTAIGYPCVTTIAAGTDSPFTVHVYSPPQDVDHVTANVSQYFEPPANLIYPLVTGLDASMTSVSTDSLGRRHVTGAVINNSSNTYDHVRPCVAYYDAAGDVVRTDSTFSAPATLAPGDTGTFESVMEAEGTGIVSERVWANALYAP